MAWRRWTVRALAVLVFLALPYALKHLGLIQLIYPAAPEPVTRQATEVG